MSTKLVIGRETTRMSRASGLPVIGNLLQSVLAIFSFHEVHVDEWECCFPRPSYNFDLV